MYCINFSKDKTLSIKLYSLLSTSCEFLQIIDKVEPLDDRFR